MAVSTRTRFEIFKRDNYRCHYCGATPLQSALHIDHVVATANGGTDDPSNLITACKDCNLGKSAVPLDKKRFKATAPETSDKDHAEQIREYLQIQRDIIDAKKEVVATALDHWQDSIGDWPWQLPKYMRGAVESLGLDGAIAAVDAVARKNIRSDIDQVKYFCGVVRSKRKEGAIHAPPAALDVEAEKWKVAISIFGAYWDRAVDEERPADFEAQIRRALGGSRSIGFPMLFELIDDLVYGQGEGRSANPPADFARFITQAFEERGDDAS